VKSPEMVRGQRDAFVVGPGELDDARSLEFSSLDG